MPIKKPYTNYCSITIPDLNIGCFWVPNLQFSKKINKSKPKLLNFDVGAFENPKNYGKAKIIIIP